MGRTNSRKIQRRTLKKKSPVPAVLLILWMATICMVFVYQYMPASTLDYELKAKKADVTEVHNRIRNLTAEVEKLTARRYILEKVEEFKLGLREPLPGQVYHVRHIQSGDGLPAQRLRDDYITEEVAAARR